MIVLHVCVYSTKMVGTQEGSTKAHLQKNEKDYICGGKVPSEQLYVQRRLICGDYIESQYYSHLGGKTGQIKKGAQLFTESIWAIHFTFKNIMSEDEIKKSRDICNNCFESGVKIPTSSGCSNVREKKRRNSKRVQGKKKIT